MNPSDAQATAGSHQTEPQSASTVTGVPSVLFSMAIRSRLEVRNDV